MDLKTINIQSKNNVDSAEKYTTLLSFCTGIRGIERGLERIIPNLRTICCVEREAFIIENLVAEMEVGVVASCPIWPDVTNFPAEHFRGMVDIFTGGYPCPGESVAGKRLGEDDPRWLWKHFERSITIIQPKICFFENVRGHVTKGLPTVIASLEEMGYRVHWGIFSAEETGASHKRERVFIMGVRKDLLDNTSGFGFKQEHEISTGRNGIESTSEELGNTQHNGLNESEDRESIKPGDTGGCNEDVANTKSKFSQQREDTWQRGSGSTDGSEAMANTNDSRGREDSESSQLRTNGSEQSPGNSWGYKSGQNEERRSVARPGQPQHPWESPRTVITKAAARLLGGYGKKYPESFPEWQIDQVAFDGFTGSVKPDLGVTTDGYNFREDFLRALGNSVYADTAKLAWRTLTAKFFESAHLTP